MQAGLAIPGCAVTLTVALSLLFIVVLPVFRPGNYHIAMSDPRSNGELASSIDNVASSPPATVTQPTHFSVRVWRNGNIVDLTDSVPIATGDRIEIRADVPAGMHISLFLFDSEGVLRLVDSRPAAATGYVYRYPSDKEQFEQIVGSQGTEVIFLCGRRDRPITVEEVRELGIFTQRWPTLAKDSVIEMSQDNVEFLQRGRDFGGGDTVDSQQVVFDQLEQLRKKLTELGEVTTGVAFSHVE